MAPLRALRTLALLLTLPFTTLAVVSDNSPLELSYYRPSDPVVFECLNRTMYSLPPPPKPQANSPATPANTSKTRTVTSSTPPSSAAPRPPPPSASPSTLKAP